MADRPAIARVCADAFVDWRGQEPSLVCWSPGRINVIGGHTDYNNGLALPAAINCWVAVAFRERSDDRVHVRSLDFDGHYETTLGSWPAPQNSWQQFVGGALQVFAAEHPFPSGFDAVFVGDVPHGAGLSSSAALTVAWMNLLRTWTKADVDEWSLVRFCQQVEHEHLGVQCGLLDQVASHMAQAGHVMRVDFQDLSLEQVPVRLPDVSWVVLHSGVRRELAESGYSDRVRECAEGLAAVKQLDPSVVSMRDVTLDHLDAEAVWGRRLRHVVTENQRVVAAAECMADGDLETLGRLLLKTHDSLRDDYEVSCPQLDALVTRAAADSACWGGRMVGGGFGGCTLNLVRSDEADGFIQRILGAYREEYDLAPRSFRFRLVGGSQVEG